VRVTFPFAPIERQLASGRVEVSSLRFIAALPLELMKYFEAQDSVKVPLPLEEIFQNLPHQVPMPIVLPTATTEHAAAYHEPESKLVTPARTDVTDASAELPPTGPVENPAPSVDMPLQSPISWAAPAPPMEAAASAGAQPTLSSNEEPGLVRAFVPSLRPPVLIRAGADSGVLESVFAELQTVDLSRPAVLSSEETMSVASPSLATSPIEQVTPPSSAEHAEATEATGSELPEAMLSVAPPQAHPIIGQPPPIFVTAITSEADERQPANATQPGTNILVGETAGSIVEQAVEQFLEPVTGRHESGLAEVESQATKSAEAASAKI
jgi:hypothetical protein